MTVYEVKSLWFDSVFASCGTKLPFVESLRTNVS
ncbi:Uncharacterised protein [Mycobacteroides abscessus subsp. abscessus]|nr:Uncharacterised protein [Mycobacteroides abscessus subsp. abscessus]